MDSRLFRRKILYFSYGVIVLVASIYLIAELRELILPVILGSLLAYLFKPILSSIKFSFIPDKVRVTLLLLAIIFGIFNLYKFVKSQIPNESQKIELMVRVQYKLNEKFNNAMGIDKKTGKGNFVYSLVDKEIKPFMEQVNYWLVLNKKQQREFIREYRKTEDPLKQKYYEYFKSNKKNFYKNKVFLQEIEEKPVVAHEKVEEEASFLGKLINTLSTWLVLPFVFIFLLFDNGQIYKYFVHLLPNRYFELSLTVIDEVDQALGKYLRGTILECSLVGLTLGIGLFLIGIDFKIALAIGLIAGITNAIPFLGPAMGLIVGLSYALVVENINPILPFINADNVVLGVVVAVIIAQLLDNTVYQPIVLGSAVNLHPLVVIIGVMGGSIIFGFAGMLLAIPSIVIVKVIIETLFRELKAYRIV